MILSILPIFLMGVTHAQDAGKVKPYDPSTYYVSFAEPEELGVIGNPLDYAGMKINMNVRNFELPRGYEGRYKYACRFPIIDYVSNNPLYMKQWTEDNAERIAKEHTDGGILAVNYGLELLRGYNETESWKKRIISNGYKPENLPLSIDEFKQKIKDSNFTDKYQAILVDLYFRYLNAFVHVQLAKANLTKDDIEFFTANPAYYVVPDGKRIPEITGNVDTFFNFIEHARRVKFEEIYDAAICLSDAINQYVTSTKDFKVENYYKDVTKANEIYKIETPGGSICISGFGDDKHSDDALILVDLGGNDIYTNNAGGALQSASILIDHSGNDQYVNPSRRFIQGFGFMGVGYLVDLGGNDKYSADSFAQGAGIMGVGAIWDRGGDDYYDASGFVQGAGVFGLGMLLDSSGEDFYNAATLCQGGATTLGLGILSDLSGDDRYHLWMDTSKDNLGSTG